MMRCKPLYIDELEALQLFTLKRLTLWAQDIFASIPLTVEEITNPGLFSKLDKVDAICIEHSECFEIVKNGMDLPHSSNFLYANDP